jgi:hypothetical protein
MSRYEMDSFRAAALGKKSGKNPSRITLNSPEIAQPSFTLILFYFKGIQRTSK